MSKLYEKVNDFNNSKLGIIIGIVAALAMVVIFSICLTINVDKRRTFFILASLFFIGIGVYSLAREVTKAYKLKSNKNK